MTMCQSVHDLHFIQGFSQNDVIIAKPIEIGE